MQKVGGDSLILTSNLGNSSRQYAVYKGINCLLNINFYSEPKKIVVSFSDGIEKKSQPAPIANIAFSASLLEQIFDQSNTTFSSEQITTIGMRLVAPSKKFQNDTILDKRSITELQKLESKAKNEINSAIQEVNLLKRYFPKAEIIGVSDTAFHIKNSISGKYGYFGLSVESVVSSLQLHHYLPGRLIVCHMGDYTSVTAALNGKSIDTTDNYSWQDKAQIQIPNSQFILQIRKSIGGMVASLGGIDSVVFTGRVGERDASMRKKVVSNFEFIGAKLDTDKNKKSLDPEKITQISSPKAAVKIYVVPCDENKIIARHAMKF